MKKILPFFILGFLLLLNFSQAQTFTYFPLGKYDEDFYNFDYTTLKGRQQWYLASGLNINPYTFTDMRGVSRNVPKIDSGLYTLATDAFWITIPNDNRINYVVVYYGFEGMEVKVKIESAIGEEWVLDEDSASVPLKTRYRIFNIKDIITGANPPYRLVFWGYFLNMWYQNEYITKLVPINVQFLDSEMRVIDNQEFNETTLYFTDFSTSNPFTFGYGNYIQPIWESKYINIAPPLKYYPYSWLSITYNATDYDSFFYSSTSSYYNLRGKNIETYRVDLTSYMFCYPPINKTTIFIWNATPDNVVNASTKIEIYRDKVNVYLLDKDFHIIDGEVNLATGNLINQDSLTCMNKLIYLRTPTYARLIGVRGDKNIVLIDIPYRLTTSFNRVVYMWDTEIVVNNNIDSTDFMILSGAMLPPPPTPLGCFDINESGYYELTSDIYADKDPCIQINASNVVLDLKGHTINLPSGIYNGINVYNYSTEIPYLENITIKNGRIFGDYRTDTKCIYASYVKNLTLDDITLEGCERGLWGTWLNNATIKNSKFLSNQYGINPATGFNWLVRENEFYNVLYDFNGAIWNSTFIKNKFGNITINPECCTNKTIFIFPFGWITTTTCITPCGGIYEGANTSLYCYGCLYNDFVGNWYFAFSRDADFVASEKNRFIREVYTRLPPPNPQTGLYLDSTSKNNWGCEVQGYIYDSGINNTFIATCPSTLYPGETPGLCLPGWVCLNSTVRAYRLTDCSYTSAFPCPENTVCQNGECVSVVPPVTPQQPLANATEWQELGIAWALPLTTPIFILTMVALGVSGFISMKIGGNYAGLVFSIAMLFFVIIYAITGVYPIWISIILIILTAGLIAYFIKGMF